MLELTRSASARSALAMLDVLAARMPFPVRAISVDGGSEFMADFELAPQPKLHGPVEHASRTHTDEFYEITDVEPHWLE